MIEALVVGGGPAGTSAAIGLAQSGCSVKLIEQRPIWSGRVCGSFLSPEASLQLERLNLIPFIKGNAIAVPDTVMTTPSGAQKRISIRHKNRPGLALSRQILESTLLKAAERTGIEIQTGCRLISHEKSGNGWNVVVQEDHTRNLKHVDLLILADGRYSMGHLKSGQDENGWFGFNAPFENVNQAPGEQSLHFFPGGYVGVLTFADGVSNLCGLIRRPFEEKISWDNIYQRVQKKSSPLRKLVESAQRIGEWRGVGPLPFGVHIEEGNGPLLAGDSAAVADPFMGKESDERFRLVP